MRLQQPPHQGTPTNHRRRPLERRGFLATSSLSQESEMQQQELRTVTGPISTSVEVYGSSGSDQSRNKHAKP